jgi:Glyoxalase-like domain
VSLPRIRQAVLAARNLEDVAGRLQSELGLGDPFADPGVEYFGLRNAVFALSDTFLEVVSPVRDGTSAGRLLERRGGDCGYMVMFQIEDLSEARARASAAGVREVFEVTLDDIEEVHLHPADMRGAIISLSTPKPPQSWRWGGPEWEQRSAPVSVAGVRIGAAHPEDVQSRWDSIIGGLGGATFVHDEADRGPVEIALAEWSGEPVEIGGVRFVPASSEEV